MVIEEMTAAECRSVLAAATAVRLGCALDNQPYIVPIHIYLDGGFVYAYATDGQKIAWMRQNPLVCLQIDELITQGQWASVVVFGHYDELPNTRHDEDSRRIAERLFEQHPMWWEPASVPLPGHAPRTPVVFRIRIDRMTGRRAAPTP